MTKPKGAAPKVRRRNETKAQIKARTKRGLIAAGKKRKENLLEEYKNIYAQMLRGVPVHSMLQLNEKTSVGPKMRRSAMKHIRGQIHSMSSEDDLLVAVEAQKIAIEELKKRLVVFSQDEQARTIERGMNLGGSDVPGEEGKEQPDGQARVVDMRKPNRNAEIGLRKLIHEKEVHLHNLQGLLEIHRSSNQIVLDVNGVLLIHSIMMTLVAEFVPKTEEQMSFRRRLSEILRSLGDGKLSRNSRLDEGLAPDADLIDIQALSE